MMRSRNSRLLALAAVTLAMLALLLPLAGQPSQPDENVRKPLLLTQSKEEAAAKSAGCVSCHGQTDEPTMHATGTVRLGCADCHGGDATAIVPTGAQPGSAAYEESKRRAHPQPSFSEDARTAANQPRLYTRWLRENRSYVRFVNPGDLRVAAQTCGVSGCHATEVGNVRSSMMTHGAMLWNAALYNNGSVPFKTPRFGEAYDPDGKPARLNPGNPPTALQMQRKGVLPYLEPLERWEISQPGNVLRVFERGGDARGEVGNPLLDEAPGRPDVKLSDRGFGTLLRTDPVFLGLQKTRLMDPLLSLPGTNDHPGDYRASGCSACHVVYANDSSPEHSGSYAQFGHSGFSASGDPTLRRNEAGHPIAHRFTRAIPSSQCMVCHMHPGTNMVATYFGVTWWDNEVDGEQMYPAAQRNPSPRQSAEAERQNPEGAAARGLWSDPKFLERTGSADFNARLKHTRFADFHSHGWIFRAVFKQDRHGQLLDAEDKPIANGDPERLHKAVQLMDIHAEKGMHCVDCHFTQDNHGNGNLYGETRNAIEIDCTDCHGTIKGPATLLTSGPAAPADGHTLLHRTTPWKQAQFYWKNGLLYQRSMLAQDREWEVVQVVDTITPGRPHYSEQSRLAKTVLRDGSTWGLVPAENSALAHSNERMTCFACHSSWTTSCFGCHLSMTANQRKPMLHNEGLTTRNWTAYNFQVLRDDVYMLGVDGTVTGNRVAPVRSACAVLVSSQNQNRDWIYYSQQTVSAEGFSGQAFSPYVPHTVRARETRRCSDCHVSAAGNNNAWMSQLLMQGTGVVNQMGRSIYVAAGKGGFHAVPVAERSEPEAVIGSDLHRIAYPDNYKHFVAGGRRLKESEHHAGAEVLDVQLRGEYLYAALGRGGFRAFDVANIENKDFSEKMITAPVSPLGQRFAVKTSYATSVGSPSTLAIDPLRRQSPENEEQKIHPMYGFLYVTDRDEGLVIIGDANPKARTPGVGTLLDGDPTNNFLKRALAFNPGGALQGARRIAFAGTYAYVLCDRGLAVVDLDQPLAPKIVAEIAAPALVEPVGLAVQFRYLFVVDRQGLKVLDITHPDRPQPIANAFLPLEDTRNVYIARTYAYIAAGAQGIAVVDVERPDHPRLQQMFNAGGALNDTRDVKIGMTSSSLFAYVADGRNGLRVVQLLSPADSLEIYGFSPAPKLKLIATYRTHGPALAVSRGIDRDRAVDESGNQLAVFGRRGSRPFTGEELRRMYLRNGELYTVSDQPPRPAQASVQK